MLARCPDGQGTYDSPCLLLQTAPTAPLPPTWHAQARHRLRRLRLQLRHLFLGGHGFEQGLHSGLDREGMVVPGTESGSGMG